MLICGRWTEKFSSSALTERKDRSSMRNLTIIFSILCFTYCSSTDSHQDELQSYIFDSLKVQRKGKERQDFLILNPNTKCWACYQGAVQELLKNEQQNNITIITSNDI